MEYRAPVNTGTKIRRVLKSAEAMSIMLDESVAASGPFDGCCLICAKAIIQAFGRGSLVRLVGTHGLTDHYGALVDGLIYDADGVYRTWKAWNKRFATVGVLGVCKKVADYTFAEGYDLSADDIPDDPYAVKKLTQLLQNSYRLAEAWEDSPATTRVPPMAMSEVIETESQRGVRGKMENENVYRNS